MVYNELFRPIAGHANLCPDSISTKAQDLETLLSTVKHEILHALGFSVSLYAYFRDKDGNPLTSREKNGKPSVSKILKAPQWSDSIIRTVIRKDWKVRGKTIERIVNLMVTPKVVVSFLSLLFDWFNFFNFFIQQFKGRSKEAF